MKISYKNIYCTDNDIYGIHLAMLYMLLAQRESWQNISHVKVPTYKDHVKFVDSKPYHGWWAIYKDTAPVGAMYLTHTHEVGIFIDKVEHGAGIGAQALKWLVNKYKGTDLYANINPRNVKSQRFFDKAGFKLHQFTYRLPNSV